MGQRLVASVKKNDDVVATLYFHWDAYSLSSVITTKSIVDYITDSENIELIPDLILRLIRYAEEHGGGIDGGEDSKEWKYITEKYPAEIFKADFIERNNGLVAISLDGMAEMQSWSEGDVVIDLDTNTIHDSVFFSYGGIEELNEDRKEWMDEDEYEPLELDDIPEFDVNPENCSFDDIETLIENLENISGGYARYGDTIFSFIE